MFVCGIHPVLLLGDALFHASTPLDDVSIYNATRIVLVALRFPRPATCLYRLRELYWVEIYDAFYLSEPDWTSQSGLQLSSLPADMSGRSKPLPYVGIKIRIRLHPHPGAPSVSLWVQVTVPLRRRG